MLEHGCALVLLNCNLLLPGKFPITIHIEVLHSVDNITLCLSGAGMNHLHEQNELVLVHDNNKYTKRGHPRQQRGKCVRQNWMKNLKERVKLADSRLIHRRVRTL